VPSRTQPQRILTGGLNLLPPSDLIQQEQARDLLNFRVDSAGALRSRRGHIRDSIHTFVHSLFRRGNDRYGVTGGTLRTRPDLSAIVANGFVGQVFYASFQGVTWVMNPARRGLHAGGSTPFTFRNWLPDEPTGKMIATAGAEHVVAIAEFDSVEAWTLTRWVNGARRVEPDAEVPLDDVGVVSVTNGSAEVVGTNTAWTSALDGKNILIHGSDNDYYTVIASVTDATHLTLMAPYDGSSAPGRNYLITETKPAKSYVAGISGTALSVNCDPAGRWQVETDFAARNLLIDGKSNDADVFRFSVRADNPGAIAAVRVTLLAGPIGENRQYVTATVPAAAINPTADGWTQIRISRGANPFLFVESNADYQELGRRLQEAQIAGRSIEADELLEQRRALFDQLVAVAPPFFRAPNGVDAPFDWANVTGLWIEAEVTEATGLRFDRAEIQGRVAGSLSGYWTFWASFSTDDGHETNGAAASDAIRLDNQPVTLSAIPVSADPQVTKRHIYGVGPGVEEPLRFATIEDNVTTSLALAVDARDVQDRGTAMVLDADPPPAADGILGPYFNRLVAWKGSRLYWTPKDQPWKFPGSGDEDEGNWVDAGDDTDPIQCITDHARMMVIYKRDSIWRVNGDIDQVGVDPERTAASTGARGPRCVCTGAGVDYFLGAEGVYAFDGQREVKISQALDPLFRGEWAKISGGVLLPPLNRDSAGASVMAYRAGRVYLSYPDSIQAEPSATLVYDTETKRWARDSGFFRSLYDEGPAYALMGSIGPAGVYELESGTDDAGDPIPVIWQSPSFDQGLPNNPKVYSDLVIDFESPDPLVVKVLYDDGTAEALASIFSTNGRSTTVLPLAVDGQGRRGRMIAVRIVGDIRAEAVIYGVHLHWYPEERNGKSFDSGVLDFSGPARVIEIEAEITSAAPVNWAVDTDNFGAAIAERDREAMPATSRKPVLARLKAAADGRRGRVRMWSDGEFQLHSLTVRVEGLRVGVGPGETWRSLTRN